MSRVSEIAELLSVKDDALEESIAMFESFMENCPGNGCDLTANPPYHWKGCRTVLNPFITKLYDAMIKK